MGEKFEQFSSQTSSPQRLVKDCVEKGHGSGRAFPPEPAPATAPKSKLSAAEVRGVKQSFSQSYPGELLTPASTPSASFLTLVKDATDSNTLGWIPWKSRTSEQDELDYIETRRPRNDRHLLKTIMDEGSAVLYDAPEAVFQSNAPVEVVLPKFQGLLSTALAMVNAAHLLVLKRFHNNFFLLATARPRDSNLRAP